MSGTNRISYHVNTSSIILPFDVNSLWDGTGSPFVYKYSGLVLDKTIFGKLVKKYPVLNEIIKEYENVYYISFKKENWDKKTIKKHLGCRRVIERIGLFNGSSVALFCRCKCGEYCILYYNKNSKNIKHCHYCRKNTNFYVGKRHGMLEIIDNLEYPIISCKCDCGKIVKIDIDRFLLKTKFEKSCGCSYKEKNIGIGLIDITGKRFRNWTVIRYHGVVMSKGLRRGSTWLCRCDCGFEAIRQKCFLTNRVWNGNSCRNCKKTFR